MKSLIVSLCVIAVSLAGFSQTINRAEYFFNADPGVGNGVALPVTPAASVNQSFNISTGTLPAGFHSVNTRVRNSDGIWSLFASRTFFVILPAITFVPSTQLVEAEYFIDNDPGVGNAVSASFTPTASPTFNISIPINSLSVGFHTINVRVRDNQNRWSLFAQRTFYIVPPVNNVSSVSITKAEYFINNDPGVGNGSPLAITLANAQNNTFSIDVTALSPGFHRVGIRYQDDRGQWSHFTNRTFYVVPTNTLSSTTINKIEYSIDNDPDLNPNLNGTGVVVTPSANINQTIFIDLTNVAPGPHTIYVRAQDNQGRWSTVKSETFTIANCSAPSAPAASNVSRCGSGSLTLTATGATATQVYRWYADNTTTVVLSTGAVFTTPVLSASRNYHVSVFDPVTGCEGARTVVTAQINFASKPLVTPSDSVSFCQGSTVILSAPSGFSQYKWSTGESTRQVLVSTAGKYAVQVGDGTCLSPASDTVKVTVLSGPPKPAVTVSGNTTICGSGNVVLTAPAGFSYIWSGGQTTQSITASASGVYFVVVQSGSGCRSIPSDPVAVTVLTPPCGGGNPNNAQPVIDTKPITSPIEGVVSLDLTQFVKDSDNNIDFSSLRLLSSFTARGASASINAAYQLQINYVGLPFTGTDRIGLEVCDLVGACVQQVLDIEVVGAVVVFNGISPDGDGINDIFLLKYVDVVEGARDNRVTIFNRWGDTVFDVEDYNNIDRVFNGKGMNGADLPSGNYFYKIEFSRGLKSLSGFLTIKR